MSFDNFVHEKNARRKRVSKQVTARRRYWTDASSPQQWCCWCDKKKEEEVAGWPNIALMSANALLYTREKIRCFYHDINNKKHNLFCSFFLYPYLWVRIRWSYSHDTLYHVKIYCRERLHRQQPPRTLVRCFHRSWTNRTKFVCAKHTRVHSRSSRRLPRARPPPVPSTGGTGVYKTSQTRHARVITPTHFWTPNFLLWGVILWPPFVVVVVVVSRAFSWT